jgi:prophage regulatory protein
MSDAFTQILRLPDVVTRTGLSAPTIYRQVRSGAFPKPVSLSSQAVGWPAHEITAWIEQRIAERDRRAGRAA